MFELWMGELLEILGPREGYKKASIETLDTFLALKVSKARDKFLDNSYWGKL